MAVNDIYKIKILINQIINFISNFNTIELSPIYIHNLIISLRETFNNIKFLNPWEYSKYIINAKTYNTQYSYNKLKSNIKLINLQSIKLFLKNILKNTVLTSFVYGNIKFKNVINLFSKMNKLFANRILNLPKIKLLKDMIIKHPNSEEKSNCITYFYPIGNFNPESHIYVLLTINILGHLFFDELRTKNQLGYLVTMNQYRIQNYYYIIQKIQSDKDIKIIEKNINNFNKMIPNIIQNINFKQYIDTLNNQLIENDYSMIEKIFKYLPEIILQQYLFNKNDILIQQLKKVTHKNLIIFVNNIINNHNIIKLIIIGN